MVGDAPPDPPQPDQAWKALSLVNDWIRHAETKIAATLAATGVSAGVLFTIVRDWQEPSPPAVALGYLAGVGFVSAAWACAMGLIPRRSASREDRGLLDLVPAMLRRAYAVMKRPWRGRPTATQPAPPPDEVVNLLFYADIMRAYGDDDGAPAYEEVLATLTSNPREMTRHVGRQVWANASVADRKYNWADRAVIRLMCGWAALSAIAYMRVVGW